MVKAPFELATICPRVVLLVPTITVTGVAKTVAPAALIFCIFKVLLASSFQVTATSPVDKVAG